MFDVNMNALLALATVFLAATSLADSMKPDLVVDVIVQKGSNGADKYAIQKVKVVSIIRNHTAYKIPDQIAVAHPSTENDMPIGSARLFLRKYYESSPEFCLLIQFQATSTKDVLKMPALQAGMAETQ
jgi:hypothetical protein